MSELGKHGRADSPHGARAESVSEARGLHRAGPGSYEAGERPPAVPRAGRADGRGDAVPGPADAGAVWDSLTAEQRRPYLDKVAATSLTGPEQVAANWASLEPMQRQAWIRQRPDAVGNLDGIPAADRDTANRIVLPETIKTMELQLRELEASKPPPGHSGRGAWRSQVTSCTRTLRGYQAVEEALHSDSDHRLLLMGLDNHGHGHAVIAVSNPDTATDVATFVPGTGAMLTDIGQDVQRASRMLYAAKDAGSESTSVITWYGYDAPQSVPAAGRTKYARDAAPALSSFQEGLRATHPGSPSHNTVIGHSYGTTVIGAAATRGRSINADDVILVASPGVRARTASGLSITGVADGDQGQHVYATTARRDVIRAVPPLHGRQPVAPQFGATLIESAPGGWNPVENHSAYWDPDNPALRNMGRIIAGRGNLPSQRTELS